MLDTMRREKQYDHVLLKSDYWKKFEGTVLKQGIIALNPNTPINYLAL